MYEYFLVGSVLDVHKDGLVDILRGLCDNSESQPIEFIENEFSLSFETTNETVINLKARCSKNPADKHWHLKYVGQTDLKEDKSKASMIRSYIDCLTNVNLIDYLKQIGFNLEYEATVRGNIFHKGRLKIIVSKIILPSNNDFQPHTASHFVEVTCVAPASQEMVAQEVKAFSDLLKPYIKLDKLSAFMDEANLMKLNEKK